MANRTIRQWRRRPSIVVAALMLCAAFVTGCSQDGSLESDGDLRVPVSFTTRTFYPGDTNVLALRISTSNAPQTRTITDGDEWEQDDEIGIFMINKGGSLTTTADLLVDNIQHKATPGSPASFVPVNTEQTIYYPQSGNVDFVAYYPYGATGVETGEITTAYKYNISVTDQSVPAAIDVLYVKNTDVAKSQSAVNLEFSHVLSKVTLNVKAGEGLTRTNVQNLVGTDIVFGGMPITAELALQDGMLTARTTSTFNPLKAMTATATYDATFSAILIPQPDGGTGRTLVLTVDGQDYTWTIPNTEAFAAGNHYTYPVTVKKKSGIMVGNPSITDWKTNDNKEGEAMPLPIAIVKIPKGAFMMGSPATEPNRQPNETQHKVTLTKDFWMSKYPITFAQYDAFCTATNRTPANDAGWGRNNHPVINVSWDDAVAYCQWLTEITSITCTLPTEAQWEYACRGDYPNKAIETKTLPFGIDDGKKLTGNMANINGAYPYDNDRGEYQLTGGVHLRRTSPVGNYSANNYGLYDMHGNVFDWCSDWYSEYEDGDVTDPTGPATGSERVLRGGSWNRTSQYSRSAYRNQRNPDGASNNFGFRVVFAP